ncbi:hypothetical protein P7C70_g8902, partial [Phenoliferia sp. Uapishka_3]
MESTIGFAAFAKSLAHIPEVLREQYPRMSTGGKSPLRLLLRNPLGTSTRRLNTEYQWPAKAILAERVDDFKIAFLSCWVTPAEWIHWRREVRKVHCKKESTRKHLFDYLQWIFEWMHGDMEQAAYLRLVRRLEASRRRWALVRKTFIESAVPVDMDVWEATEPYKSGVAEEDNDLHAAGDKIRRLARLEDTGIGRGEDGEDIIIPDSEDES